MTTIERMARLQWTYSNLGSDLSESVPAALCDALVFALRELRDNLLPVAVIDAMMEVYDTPGCGCPNCDRLFVVKQFNAALDAILAEHEAAQ